MDLEGRHHEVRGGLLMQVSHAAPMQHITPIRRAQGAIRISYSRFQHFMSPFEIIHGVFWPFRS